MGLLLLLAVGGAVSSVMVVGLWRGVGCLVGN